jgi:hypothetical protein
MMRRHTSFFLVLMLIFVAVLGLVVLPLSSIRPSHSYTIVSSNAVATGEIPWEIDCGFPQTPPTCQIPYHEPGGHGFNSTTLSGAQLVNYQGRLYYRFQEFGINYQTDTIWFTNSSVYCVSVNGNGDWGYPSCPG